MDLSGKRNDFYNRWRGQVSNFQGSDVRKFMLGCVLIFGGGGFWALVIAGMFKYVFDLEEVFALKYIGGSAFFLFLIWGFIRYSKDLKKYIR